MVKTRNSIRIWSHIAKCFNVLSDEDIATSPAIHSFAAVPIIKHSFPEYATKDILSAVFNHTLGCADMSLFDKIIFLSDFIEDGRKYESCKATARFVKENINKDNPYEQNVILLNHALIMAIDFTVESVKSRNESIHSSTYKMKQSLEGKI